MARHEAGTMPQAGAAGAPVLQVSNVEKTYGSKASATHALNGVTFAVEQGELTAIMGPSGSGKSTLLNCIATIDRPTAGTILIENQDTAHLSSRKLADFRREKLGFIFQDANLLDTLTGRENIALPLSIGRTPADKLQRQVEDTARALGVTEVLDRYPYQMSGGQRQRVAAARAIVTRPALVLADEPTGALDSKNAKVLLESLETLNRDLGSTILMVTHDESAASYCQRVLFIRDGRLFTQVRRGSASRRDFFDQIMSVVATMGGAEDAR